MMNISRRILYLQIFVTVSLFCLFFGQTANALSITATVNVGTSPLDIAYDSGKGEIFVANNGDDTVSVIDDATNTIITTIPIVPVTPPGSPYGIAYDSGKGEIFVVNNQDHTVSVIDDATNTVVGAPIPVGLDPYGIAYDSGKGKIFVANSGDGTVSVIDDTTNTVVATILSVGTNPRNIAYDSGKGEIFVTDSSAGHHAVYAIDDTTYTVGAPILVGTSPIGIAYDSGKGKIFVANSGDGTVSVIDDTTNTVVATILSVGASPLGVAYNPTKGEIFVANNGDDTVSVIDDATNTIITSISLSAGSAPFGIVFDAAKNKIFVANSGLNTVSVILDPASSSSGGHNVAIHHPPSLGNDYYYKYTGGAVINGKSFDITKYGIIIPQQVLQTGQPANFTFKIYDERGSNTVSHVGMYIHFKGDLSVANSDTSFVWDRKDGIQINDPEKFFSDTTISQHYDDNFAYVSIKFTPTKPMPDSSILMRMWDDKRASIDVPINGAIIIVDPNAPIPVTKVPDNQYGDYDTLVRLLDSDGYSMPPILHRVKSGSDLASTVDVYWVYDKDTDKLTMVETYKDGEIIGDTVFNLQKRPAEPTLTDHDYIYIPTQNNRQNPEQEKAVMLEEEIKAKKILESMLCHCKLKN